MSAGTVNVSSGDSATLGSLIRDAEQFGEDLAVVDGEVNLTYSELLVQAQQFGAALVSNGVETGDRVSIWAFNCVEWIVAALGIFQSGAVLVPINTRFKGSEATDILKRSGASTLVTVTDFLGVNYLEMLRSSSENLPDLRNVVIARGPDAVGATNWAGFMSTATPESTAELLRRREEISSEQPSDILFTSGTTGVAKGVVQTHSRTHRTATDWVEMTGLGAGDRYLMVNPYFHMFGLKAGILASVAAGATMMPEAVFDVERTLERVEGEKVTVLPGAPTIYQSLLDHPKRNDYDLSSLRVAVTGAADIPVELIARIREELPFDLIVTGYGLTEGGTAAATSPDDDPETIATTVGRPRPGFEIQIVDGSGNVVDDGETGEILLRGASIMLCYLDDLEATSKALSDDGWLSTGDLGVINEAGCLRIVGRSKDMFIVGGFNAYPAEIESALMRHEAVSQAAVIGIPDERLGEVGMAFVVVAKGKTLDADELIAWSREEMANYKAPRRVEAIDELPINATGKVMKEVLRERA